MTDTGRLRRGLRPQISHMLFERSLASGVADELPHIAHVDLAHLLGLHAQGLLEAPKVARLIRLIRHLVNSDFEVFREREAPRGLYLSYENYLIEQLGLDVAGSLQLGRSRNDLGATTLLLRLRRPFLHLLRDVGELAATLLTLATEYSQCDMPAFTHGQPAMPVTYGHYCLGVAFALEREIASLVGLRKDIDRCPLGASAVGGTSVPLAREETAQRLGFEETCANSIDAVASRDIVLRLLASAASIGVLLSRVGTDFMYWSSFELQFLEIPDHVAGSSSAMPQKKNPFLLEHVQSRGATAVGAHVAACSAMLKSPFSNR